MSKAYAECADKGMVRTSDYELLGSGPDNVCWRSAAQWARRRRTRHVASGRSTIKARGTWSSMGEVANALRCG